ncbi:hypothetical protein HPP92_011057 [Vanilla planifolia]|uniref:CCHC-type domain-containing protein n=1 Tax=Vanilla planifolia TaxID=51239 RepID=A0A835QWV8_VANPL|nr:hypothetical protein HPP92_011057 [Vanilla planifolia]
MATVGVRKKGCVTWFDGCKGFGFIIPGDVFVHRSSVKAICFISLTKEENVFSIKVGEYGRYMPSMSLVPGAYLLGGKGPCFSRGEFGHLERDCILSNGGCRWLGPCFSCRGMGHLFRQCPARQKFFKHPSSSTCPWEQRSLDSQLSQNLWNVIARLLF